MHLEGRDQEWLPQGGRKGEKMLDRSEVRRVEKKDVDSG